MAKIHVLGPHLAELIAAGEVVERPASAVKEMVENAIDSGATAITVEIKNGGTKLMKITDNGSGIEEEDVENAFVRHATSKIATEDDLENIMTLGFRGEALASIAAVSKVHLRTKTKNAQFGTSYTIEGGRPGVLEPAGCPDGTEITVEDLFYNTPARMKFLKKDVSEGNAVSAILDKLALSHPEISFRFVRDGKETLFTPGDGKLLSAIRSVLGAPFAKTLIPAAPAEEFGIRVSGFISRPTESRPTKGMQHFFINGRYVKTNTCAAALEKAYQGSVMVGKYPSCVLFVEMPAQLLDVNVHPAKTEVRFQNEREVFLAVYYCVKTALFSGQEFPELQVEKVKQPELPKYENLRFGEQKQGVPLSSTPSEQAQRLIHDLQKAPVDTQPVKPAPQPEKTVQHQEVFSSSALPLQVEQTAPPAPPFLLQQVDEDEVVEGEFPSAPTAPAEPQLPFYRLIGEAYATYIIVELENELLFIDKHASHERYLFEKLKDRKGGLDRQLLLMPLQISLSGEEYDAVLNHLDLLASLGFAVEDFGPGTVLVREVPLLLANFKNIEQVVMEAAGSLVRFGKLAQPKELEDLYHSIACKAAIKGHIPSTGPDLDNIIRLVLSYREIRYCPHGRPVAFALPKASLDRQFGRLG